MATESSVAMVRFEPPARVRRGISSDDLPKVRHDLLRLALDTVGRNDQALEDRLIQQASSLGVAAQVQLTAIWPNQPQKLIECPEDVLSLMRRRLDQLPRLRPLRLDPLLLSNQDLFGNTTLVVEMQKLLLLILELTKPASMLLGSVPHDVHTVGGLLAHDLARGFALSRRQAMRR